MSVPTSYLIAETAVVRHLFEFAISAKRMSKEQVRTHAVVCLTDLHRLQDSLWFFYHNRYITNQDYDERSDQQVKINEVIWTFMDMDPTVPEQRLAAYDAAAALYCEYIA